LSGNPSNDFVGAEQVAAGAMLPAQTTLAVGSIGGVLLFFVIAAGYLPHNKQQAGVPVDVGPRVANRNG
jgi:hypothetical protein